MKKKEYIERGPVLERNMRGNTAPITHRTYAERLISSAPAADVVEVVRCKDCVCWVGNEYWANRASHGKCYCPDVKISMGAVLFTKPDDYCSHGERKEE